MFEYQVSLFCKSGKYRPVSTIVRRKVQVDLTNATDKKKIMNDGIIKICQMRGWTSRDLQRYDYLKSRVREYDKEKIEREKNNIIKIDHGKDQRKKIKKSVDK